MSGKCCVYSIYNQYGDLIYIGISVNPKSRLANHLGEKFWSEEVSEIKIKWFESVRDARDEEERLIKEKKPKYNKQLNPDASSVVFYEGKNKELSDEMRRIISSFPTRKDFFVEINKLYGPEIKPQAVLSYIMKGDFSKKMNSKYSISRRIAVFFHQRSEIIQTIRPDVKDWYL